MLKTNSSPTSPFTCEIGEIIPDIEAPFYPPFMPVDDVMDFLDNLEASIEEKLNNGDNPEDVAKFRHEEIYNNLIIGRLKGYAYQRLTPVSQAIVDEDYHINEASPANLWIQPLFDPHSDPHKVILTVFDGSLRRLSVAAYEDRDFVIIHRRSGRPCCRFNSIDIVSTDRIPRIIGDDVVFHYMPIPKDEMQGRVHTWFKNFGIPFTCRHELIKAPTTRQKFICD